MTLRARAAGLAALAAVALVAAAPGPAPTTLHQLDAERLARAGDRDADRARADQAAAAVARLKAELAVLDRDQQTGARTLGGARAALGRLDVQEATLKLAMAHNQQSLTHLLAALQMFSRDPPPALLVDPHSARDAVRAAILIQAITPELRARAKTFAAQSQALKRLQRQADVQNGAVFEAESAEADRQARIETLIAQKEALQKQLDADAALAQADVQRLAERARSLGEFVSELDTRKSAPPESEDAPRLVAPVAAPLLQQGPNAGPAPGEDGERGQGVTFAPEPGAEVVAPAAGVVDYAGPLKGWGEVLILRAGADEVVLAGLGEVEARTGASVAAGEKVGKMPGDTAHPSLYLELRRAGRPVDPAPRLAATAPPPG